MENDFSKFCDSDRLQLDMIPHNGDADQSQSMATLQQVNNAENHTIENKNCEEQQSNKHDIPLHSPSSSRDRNESQLEQYCRDGSSIISRIPSEQAEWPLMSATSDNGELPTTFCTAVKYFISSAPPGQLPRIVESCRSLLLHAMTAVDNSQFSAAVQFMVDRLCYSHAEYVSESNFALIPISHTYMESSYRNKQTHPSIYDFFNKFNKRVAVIQKLTRVQNPKSYTFPWYLFVEGCILIQVDTIKQRLLNVVCLNSYLRKQLLLEDLPDNYLSQLRKEIEYLLRHEFIPSYYTIPNDVGLSVYVRSVPQLQVDPLGKVCLATHSGTTPIETHDDTPIISPQLSFHTRYQSIDTESPKLKIESASELNAIQIIMMNEQVNYFNFWSGSWKSVWDLQFDPAVTGEVTLKGKLQVKLHYTEEGSVLLRQSKELSCTLKDRPTDVKEFASLIVKMIKKEEFLLYTELHRFYFALHTTILRSLRRLFPINSKKFDWSLGTPVTTRDIVSLNLAKQLVSKELKEYKTTLLSE